MCIVIHVCIVLLIPDAQRALLSKWYLVLRLSTDEVSVSVEIADRVLTEEQNRTL